MKLQKIVYYHVGSEKLDLGAQWLHGKTNNPLYELLNSKGLLIDKQEVLYYDETLTGK